MKVNINFDYDPLTKNVTNLKVIDLEISDKIRDLTKSLVTLKSTTLQLNQDLLDHLGLKVNDKIGLRFTDAESGHNSVVLANPRDVHPTEDSTHRITQKLTISVRGTNLDKLSAMGNLFSMEDIGHNKIKLNATN